MKQFEVSDPLGRAVSLSSEAWEHIIQGHPPLERYLHLVESTVRSPDYILRDSSGYSANRDDYHRLVYVAELPSHLYDMIVVVEHETVPGAVETAWVTSKLKRARTGEGIRYERP